MYCNILAEMTRAQITKEEIAQNLGISVSMLEEKLNSVSGFKVKEIFKLQKMFNNSICTFEYLMLADRK